MNHMPYRTGCSSLLHFSLWSSLTKWLNSDFPLQHKSFYQPYFCDILKFQYICFLLNIQMLQKVPKGCNQTQGKYAIMCTYHVLHRLSIIYIIYVFLHNFSFLCFLCVCEIMQKSVSYHQKYRNNLSQYSYFTQSALLPVKPLEKPLEKSFHMHQTSIHEEKNQKVQEAF